MSAKAITESRPLSRTGRILINLGAIAFFVGGLVGFWLIMLAPTLNVLGARSWPQTECEVTSSSLKRHRGDDGDTWSAEITFKYQVDNEVYHSDTYSFYNYSGSKKPARKVVDAHPSGKKTRCYYDPANPETAVIDRSFHFISLLGCLFLLMTFGAMLTFYYVNRSPEAARKRKRTNSGTSHDRNHTTAAELFSPEYEGPQRLKPESTRLGRLLGITFFALIWNSIVGVMGYSLFSSGSMDFCFTIFLIPFALVGILLIGAVVHQLLAMTNPVVVIALSNGTAVPGETLEIAWETQGRASRLRNLSIVVEAIEEATYTRGTDRITDKETICHIVVADVTDHAKMEFGSHFVDVPSDALPSFEADNNKITWSIRANGEIPFWPDVTESFPFRVKPA